MPEHCQLLLWPSELADPSQIMPKLAERTASFILRNRGKLPRSQTGAWVKNPRGVVLKTGVSPGGHGPCKQLITKEL